MALMNLIYFFFVENITAKNISAVNISTSRDLLSENWDELQLKLQNCYPFNNGDCEVSISNLSRLQCFLRFVRIPFLSFLDRSRFLVKNRVVGEVAKQE